MGFRTEEVTFYKTFVICDRCGKETVLCQLPKELKPDSREHRAKKKGHTFVHTGEEVENFCDQCTSGWNIQN